MKFHTSEDWYEARHYGILTLAQMAHRCWWVRYPDWSHLPVQYGLLRHGTAGLGSHSGEPKMEAMQSRSLENLEVNKKQLIKNFQI